MEGIIDVYNVFNWANFTTSNTNAVNYSSSTGVYTPTTNFGFLGNADAKTREVQFTIKLKF